MKAATVVSRPIWSDENVVSSSKDWFAPTFKAFKPIQPAGTREVAAKILARSPGINGISPHWRPWLRGVPSMLLINHGTPKR